MHICDISVLVCTFNRARDLRDLIDSLQIQSDVAGNVEIIVVDNNSTDQTAAFVESAARRFIHPLRYVLETRQGKSYALNRGLAEARGSIVAIVDDDQVMPPTYLRKLLAAFHTNPEAAFIGGKVLPLWEEPPPSWLNGEHWAPLGMVDYGDEPVSVNATRPICLLTCAFRRKDLLDVGGYREQLGVSDRAIGSTEDADILERLWNTGRGGLYLPDLHLLHKAPAHRMTRSYHRRWHRGHGRFESLRRSPIVEASRYSVLGVPAHLYRQAALDAAGCALASLVGRRDVAFHRETGLWFFAGFAAQRYREFISAIRRGA